MSGLTGFTRRETDGERDRAALERMAKLTYDERYADLDDVFCDSRVCAARAYVRDVFTGGQPKTAEGMHVWFDGELYNQAELLGRGPAAGESDAAVLLGLYRRHGDWSFLADADGMFAAVVYDAGRGRVHLIADRFGARFLFWTIAEGRLVWATHVGAMVEAPGFSPRIDERAVTQFLELGQLLGERSWLADVETLPMGSVVTFDLATRAATRHRYWWWDRLRPAAGRVNEPEAAEELGRLFLRAVQRRCRPGERIGVSLSGGLDSRAILAAMPDRLDPINALTFGQRGSLDVAIAASAAGVRGARQTVVELTGDNWLAPRLPGVWWNNGVVGLQHMHGIEAAPTEVSLMAIGFNGFGGDNQIRGDWLKGPATWDTLDPAHLGAVFRCDPSLLINLDEYEGLTKSDYYLIPNRGRNAWAAGSPLTETYMQARKPFMDNALMEALYALPDSLRANGRLYRRMLVGAFPRYFESIPWSQSGVPYTWPRLARGAYSRAMRVESRLFHRVHAINMPGHYRLGYSAYDRWLREEPARSWFDSLLRNPDALYMSYVPHAVVERLWDEHLRGRDHSAQICKFATLEVWLRQLLTGEYRPGSAADATGAGGAPLRGEAGPIGRRPCSRPSS